MPILIPSGLAISYKKDYRNEVFLDFFSDSQAEGAVGETYYTERKLQLIKWKIRKIK